MKYSTHVVTAVSVSTALVAFGFIGKPDFSSYGITGFTNFVALWVIVSISSLLPDIDHANSFVSNKLGFSLPFKHRGFTHYVYIWALLMFLGTNSTSIHSELMFWVGLGGLLHSFGDMHTKGGVKILGLGRRGQTILPGFLTFKTGNGVEAIFFIGYCVLLGISISRIL